MSTFLGVCMLYPPRAPPSELQHAHSDSDLLNLMLNDVMMASSDKGTGNLGNASWRQQSSEVCMCQFKLLAGQGEAYRAMYGRDGSVQLNV